MSEAIRLYNMTHDDGFAPNPYFGALSLATCKPYIREACKIGEWIAGFETKKLSGGEVEQKGLVYLAKVATKLNFDEYYKAYLQKRQEHCYCGDNIYKLDESGIYQAMANEYHCDSSTQNDDLKSKNVLICAEFYYFGKENLLEIESNLYNKLNIPDTQSRYGNFCKDETAIEFIDYVKNHKDKCKIIGEKMKKQESNNVD